MASRSVLARAGSLGSRHVALTPSHTLKNRVQGTSLIRWSSFTTAASEDKAGAAGGTLSPGAEAARSAAHDLIKISNEVHRASRHAYNVNNPSNGIASTWEDFPLRHIGPRDEDIPSMLAELGPGAETMEGFLNQVIPEEVRLPPWKEDMPPSAFSESRFAEYFNKLAGTNAPKTTWMQGGGYYSTETPPVIRRNILESPAWYTSYTPYQAEISQGRLESLLNFQTMVSDLTGLPIANASLLDEGTAAAEAMTLSLNTLPSSRAKLSDKTYVVSTLTHPSTVKVLQGRAEGFGLDIKVMDLSSAEGLKKLDELGNRLVGVLVQYPDTQGGVSDYKALADKVHEHGALLTAATDLSALTLLTPPGEWGADIAVGNSQRFGIPLGYGGPHAAFMSVKESSKRRLPGRLVGVSKDRLGRPAMRLALQTREQHIRREKATSNVCTAQALLANMAAMYAVYHGPTQLRNMAIKNVQYAQAVAALFESHGHKVLSKSSNGQVISDTITVQLNADPDTCNIFYGNLLRSHIQPNRHSGFGKGRFTFACNSEMGWNTFSRIAKHLATVTASVAPSRHKLKTPEGKEQGIWRQVHEVSAEAFLDSLPQALRRTSPYLTHPVFNSYHSETEMLRYIHHLQSKDLSLTHAMIPLGSCTMKLNATSQMELIGHPQHADIHPHAIRKSTLGYSEMTRQLSSSLCQITGMDDCTLQPNSGAQGEFAGLRAIRQYHLANSHPERDICLIPSSAHGTNPASAAMAGMRVVIVKCDTETGNLDMADLKAKCEKHKDELAAIMITYPSTFGVFEPDIIKICKEVHEHGGQVYMDGANMNAQIGLTSPGALGADVCHLNLHKTFCIPHGGGGPGVGPICVKRHLEPYLPHKAKQVPVASAALGSASILPISWAYIKTMGPLGLRQATSMALLNANYIMERLKPHYPIVYTNDKGRCAHEFILDTRPFKATCGIEAADIAKRLQDYGFHPPTLSFPIANTLMIEPTESESKEELDRLADALISIREEIRDIEEGRQPREGNVLKMAPHPQLDLIEGDGDGAWNRPYSRSKAAYPVPGLKERKFWPSVARIDDTYGDTNLYCTCPPIEDYVDEA